MKPSARYYARGISQGICVFFVHRNERCYLLNVQRPVCGGKCGEIRAHGSPPRLQAQLDAAPPVKLLVVEAEAGVREAHAAAPRLQVAEVLPPPPTVGFTRQQDGIVLLFLAFPACLESRCSSTVRFSFLRGSDLIRSDMYLKKEYKLLS